MLERRYGRIVMVSSVTGPVVVTPESAVSPMDAANTLQIPRAMVAAVDELAAVRQATRAPSRARSRLLGTSSRV